MDEQKKILIIAPQIPAYDRASGDLRFFTIIKLLTQRYKVIFLALDESSVEDRRYGKELEALGVIIYVKEFSLRSVFKEHPCCAVFFEFYFSAEYYLRNIRILEPGCLVIVDSVDIHYYREYLKYKLTGDLKDLEKSEATKKKELAIYRKADLVIAVTQEDADVVSQDAPEIPFGIIPNIHDVAGRGNEARDRKKLVFVGGFKHQPNCDAVKYFCEEIFPFVLRKHPGMMLDIIGSNVPEEFAQYENEHVHFLGFVSSVTPYLHKSYISIAPLRFGAGMKGKIGEAMAHGLPVVTTPIGVQGLGLKHKQHIMVAKTPEDFASCIIELVEDEGLYANIATRSLEYIQEHFTPEKIREELFELFEKVLSGSTKRISLLSRGKILLAYTFKAPRVFLGRLVSTKKNQRQSKLQENKYKLKGVNMIQEIFKYRDLLLMLTFRDIRIRYKQAAMGFLWAVFMPIVAVAAGILIKKAMAVVSGQYIDLLGIVSISVKVLPWTFFISSLKFSVQSLVGNSNLITKIYFPRAVLPLASVFACLFDFAIAVVVLIVLLTIVKLGVSIYLLWLPLILIFLVLFTAGLGLLLSAANLFFRDVKYVVEVILMFGIFFTPVFYSASTFGNWQNLLLLNPVGSILESINSAVVLKQTPDLFWLSYAGVCSVLMFIIGLTIFNKKEPLFAENI